MKVIVTGGLGFVGSVVASHLTKAGYDVLVLDNESDPAPKAKEVLKKHRIVFGKCDVRDADNLRSWFKVFQPTLVCHLAAKTKVREGEDQIADYADVNMIGTARLLEVMAEHHVHSLIYSGTSAAYGSKAPVPTDETAPRFPDGWYGRTKCLGESVIEMFSSKIRAVMFRFAVVGGAGYGVYEERQNDEHLLVRAIHAAERGVEMTVNGDDWPTKDKTPERDFVHVLDVADAFLKSIENWPEQSVIMNLGCQKAYSVLEVIREIEQTTGKKINWKYGPRRPGDVPVIQLSNGLAKKVIGWQPERGLKEMIEDAWKAREGVRAAVEARA